MGTCRKCNGRGWIEKDAVDFGNPKPKKIKLPCPDCHGTGKTGDPKEMDI
jgi:DnaJ-class molecular chaperone